MASHHVRFTAKDIVMGWAMLALILLLVSLLFIRPAHAEEKTKLTNANLNTPVSSSWKLPPSEAVKILTSSVLHGDYTPQEQRPTPSEVRSAPSNTPWDWPTPRPDRRLDGTLLTDPPKVYGLPPYCGARGEHCVFVFKQGGSSGGH